MTRGPEVTGQNPEPNFEQRPATTRFKDYLQRERVERDRRFSRRTRLPLIGGIVGGITGLAGFTTVFWAQVNYDHMDKTTALIGTYGLAAGALGAGVAALGLLRYEHLEKGYRNEALDKVIDLEVTVRMLEEGKLPLGQNPDHEQE